MAETIPAWKRVSCPTCNSTAGESCGRRPMGVPWGWVRTAPHQARKAFGMAQLDAEKRMRNPDER
jgi:hypothetical protein